MKSSRMARKLLEDGCDAAAEGKFNLAAQKFLESAKLGDVEAQNNLAALYSDHRVEDDNADSLAVHWFKRAHRGGSLVAAYNLALHYKDRDRPRWYRYWLAKAAERGDEEAILLAANERDSKKGQRPFE
jgi:TPR repeat protein